MALGAAERDVIRMVLKDALVLVGAGLVLGAPMAFWSKRIAANLLGALPLDSVMPIGVALVAMIALAVLAAYVPARRAARVNPIEALRHS